VPTAGEEEQDNCRSSRQAALHANTHAVRSFRPETKLTPPRNAWLPLIGIVDFATGPFLWVRWLCI
jgi:hypothetical protein